MFVSNIDAMAQLTNLMTSVKKPLDPDACEDLVSIIIPTFNCAHYLSRSIQSVLDQTYPNWEALVIDNHSIDNTDDVVRSFGDKRIKLFKVHNQGLIAMSRNLGIREAAGRWIAFLDADDWWMPCKLELSIQVLSKGSDFVYHDLMRAGPTSRKLLYRRIIRSRMLINPVYENLIKFGNALLNSSVVVRRDLIISAGGLSENPRLVAAEDFECWIRVARLTDRFHRISGAHGYYWIGDNNTSSSERTLISLNELRDHYLFPGEFYSPPWLSFALAKAYYEVNNYNSCQSELKKLWVMKNAIVWIRLKTIILAMLLLGKRFKHLTY